MNVTLRYGREGLSITVPDDLQTQVLRLNPSDALSNEITAIADSLRAPISTPALDKIALGS